MHPRRSADSGFTLMELLAVMLLILTVLGMGVPALFASERRSYANQAMSELIRVHQACMAMQQYLATIGDPGIITLTVTSAALPNSSAEWRAQVTVRNSTTSFRPQAWMGMTMANTSGNSDYNTSLSADQFIADIVPTNDYYWDYQPKTGFPVFRTNPNAVNKFTFKALPLGSPVVYKMTRDVNIYPQGYADIP